jgi:hypothetical protein
MPGSFLLVYTNCKPINGAKAPILYPYYRVYRFKCRFVGYLSLYFEDFTRGILSDLFLPCIPYYSLITRRQPVTGL